MQHNMFWESAWTEISQMDWNDMTWININQMYMSKGKNYY